MIMICIAISFKRLIYLFERERAWGEGQREREYSSILSAESRS